MTSDVKVTDLIIAFEPTGFFSPNASMVLGLLATAFISAMVLLFFYMFRQQIMPLRQRSAEFENWFMDWKDKTPTQQDIEQVIPQEIENMGWLTEDWKSFKDSLWQRDGQWYRLESDNDQFKSFIPTAPGFTSSVPSLLTAIGILGTFIGITVGLGQIAVQMGGGSSDEMRGAMGALIQSLGVSFRTSIWGLVLSMIGSSIQTRSLSDLKKQKEEWQHFIGKHFPVASLPKLAAEQLDAMDAQRNMTQRHIRATESSADKLGTRIEKAMNTLTDVIGNNQQEGMNELVNAFMNQMNETLGADFGQLGESLQEMVSTNKQFQDTMHDLIDNLKGASAGQGQSAEQMQEAIHSAAMAITEMKSSLSGLSGVTRSIQEAANAMQSALGAQVNAGVSQTDTIEQLLSGLREQSKGWSSQQQAMDEAGESVRSQFKDLGKAIEDLVLWHNGIKEGLNQQIHAFTQSIEAQRSVATDLASERRKAAAIVSKLAETKQSLMPTAKEMTKASMAMQKASDGLYTSEKALIELTRQLKDASREWTDRQVQSIEDYSNISSGLNSILRKIGA